MEEMTNSTLEIEIHNLLQERAISRLIIKFARFLDEKNFSAYEKCFAPDGELVTPWGGHKGRDGLKEHVYKDLGQFKATQHVSANHDIEVTGNKAVARSSLLATHTNDAEGVDFWTVGGHYNLELEIIEGNWLFTRVEIVPAWSFKSEAQVSSLH